MKNGMRIKWMKTSEWEKVSRSPHSTKIRCSGNKTIAKILGQWQNDWNTDRGTEQRMDREKVKENNRNEKESNDQIRRPVSVSQTIKWNEDKKVRKNPLSCRQVIKLESGRWLSFPFFLSFSLFEEGDTKWFWWYNRSLMRRKWSLHTKTKFPKASNVTFLSPFIPETDQKRVVYTKEVSCIPFFCLCVCLRLSMTIQKRNAR